MRTVKIPPGCISIYIHIYVHVCILYLYMCVCWGLVPLASQPIAGIIQVEFEVFTSASKRCTNEGGINVLLLHYVIALCCIYSILLIIYVQTSPNVYTHVWSSPLVIVSSGPQKVSTWDGGTPQCNITIWKKEHHPSHGFSSHACSLRSCWLQMERFCKDF